MSRHYAAQLGDQPTVGAAEFTQPPMMRGQHRCRLDP
jgi:hypothetical protein